MQGLLHNFCTQGILNSVHNETLIYQDINKDINERPKYWKYNISICISLNEILAQRPNNPDRTCFYMRVVEHVCQLFPIQIMKTVRLGLNVIEELMTNEQVKY